jgi:hypothetical protein
MLTYSELHDDELMQAAARDQRTGCVALWSVAVIFLVPGWLDHEPVLLVLGVLLGCAASFASGRCLVRGGTRRPCTTPFRPVIVGDDGQRRPRPDPTGCRTEVTRRRPCRRAG